MYNPIKNNKGKYQSAMGLQCTISHFNLTRHFAGKTSRDIEITVAIFGNR